MCSSTVIYLYSAENYICIHNHMMNVRIHVLHLFSFTLVATKLMRSLLCNRAIFRRTKESSSWPRPDIWYFKCEIHMHMIFVCMNHWQTLTQFALHKFNLYLYYFRQWRRCIVYITLLKGFFLCGWTFDRLSWLIDGRLLKTEDEHTNCHDTNQRISIFFVSFKPFLQIHFLSISVDILSLFYPVYKLIWNAF